MSAGLLSDLVRDSKLDTTTTRNGIVRHVIEVADHNSRRRRVRQEQVWKRMESLGEGTYGEVWLEKLVGGTCHVNERAVKIIKKRTQKQRPVDYSRELEAIAKFSHPKYNSCFVRSFGWFENDRHVFITMEYFPLGDLQDYLSRPLPETEVQQIAFQIVEGLKFMHHNGFAHRDLKPSNILIKSLGPDWWVKIGDFGISKRAEEGLTALRTFSGTLGFLAPEVLVQNGFLDCDDFGELREYTVAVDIWSLGEIVFRALVNKPPFPTGLASYIKGTASFPDHILRSHDITDNGRDFVRKLLLPMPTDRLSAEDALEHPWVESQKSASPRPSGELERPLSSIQNEMMRVLREEDVLYKDIYGGYACTHTRAWGPLGFLSPDEEATIPDSNRKMFKTSYLTFEIHIVKVPLVSLHGIRFKKVAGSPYHFKTTKEQILNNFKYS
ncbi:kinase-like protein [Pyrenochaeta sp. DS3sAY3a]|nr:kinase-like protein [Pyrenochaeta sp. DS3sAY3a]